MFFEWNKLFGKIISFGNVNSLSKTHFEYRSSYINAFINMHINIHMTTFTT